MDRGYKEDCLQLLQERLGARNIGRRALANGIGALAGLPLVLWAGSARAETKELVFANWGGAAMTAYQKAYVDPFEKATGIVVKQNGAGPTQGALTAQEKSGRVTWDVADLDPFTASILGHQGYVQPIDYNVVDKSKMRPGFVFKYCASSYFFSFVLAYDTARYGTKPPTSLADLFDVKKFPGKRGLYKYGTGMWEAALLAAGVPRDKLYPLDLTLAAKQIDAIKNDTIFWGSGAANQTQMLTGETSMAAMWQSRAILVEQQSKGRVKFIYNDAVLQSGAFGVLSHNPAGPGPAMKFIADAQDPKRQLVMFNMLYQGPGNPATDALIPAAEKHYNCADPANIAKEVPLDMPWYAENYSKALNEYLTLIST